MKKTIVIVMLAGLGWSFAPIPQPAAAENQAPQIIHEYGRSGATLPVGPSVSAAPAAQERPAAGVDKEVERQGKAAFKIFKEMFDLLGTAPRSEVLPQLIEKYRLIIRKYPKAPLAEEAHWKLVKMFLQESRPPREKEAMELYREFEKNYPDSHLITAVRSTFVRYYMQHKKWPELLALLTPVMGSYGEKPPGFFLFFYAEAYYQTGARQKSLPLFKQMAAQAKPGNRLARVARTRIKELESASE